MNNLKKTIEELLSGKFRYEQPGLLFSKEKIDNRIHFTLILCKDKTSQREDITELNKFDYSYLKMIQAFEIWYQNY